MNLWDFLQQEAARQGVDPALAARVMRTESGGNPSAISPKGATGPMQLMPGTAKDLGVNINDPYDNIRGGVRYLKQQIDEFGPELGLAAYNAGPGNVRKYGGVPPFAETQNYVRKNMPQSQGFDGASIFGAPAKQDTPQAFDGASIFVTPEQPKPAVPQVKAEVAQKEGGPGMIESLGAGLGKGFGTVVLNAQKYAGKGLEKIGGITQNAPNLTSLITGQRPQNLVQRAGNWLVRDADQGLTNIAAENQPYKDANPIINGAGELGGNIVATLPVGGVLGKAVGSAAPLVAGTKAAPVVEGLATAMRSGGFRAGPLAGTVAAIPARIAGGAATGGISAGLVDPETAGTGALIGGTMPVAAQLAGAAGRGLRGVFTNGGVSPEVSALAQRAKELGINIPADRLVNSKPLNAVASALNYVPFSGRAATEAAMESQLNRALSRTFGQDSDNVTMALRKAGSDLGSKFDDVLKNNAVKVDDTFLNQMAEISDSAGTELGKDGLKAIEGQINELLGKGATGQIDGQAAYNIKRTLDRIGSRNTPEAYHARELKKALMGALDRSLGPDQAAAFAKTRQQYGNMLSLQNLATNGAEGGVSVARLANMKNINNPGLQEIADIAAQFVRPREGQHGAMQRAAAALGVGGSLGLPALAGVATAGRGVNTLMNSNLMREMLLNPALPAAAERPMGLLSNTIRSVGPLIPSR